jgi:hypothetical protein
MRMKLGDRWHCMNPACGREVLVESGESEAGKNPHCSCGATMKKRYVSPAVTYLDFLKLEEIPTVAARKE